MTDHSEARFRRNLLNALDRLSAPPPDEDPTGELARRKAEAETLDGRVGRLEKITSNARTNSFWYFGILVYVVVTLMGFDHSVYFSADAKADLPVVGFSVNVTSFLYLAPLLLTVVYLYLHNQIELLWEDLSNLPHTDPKTDLPIVSRMPVWLLLEFGLQVRDRQMDWLAYRAYRKAYASTAKAQRPPFERSARRRVVGSPLGLLGGTVTAILTWMGAPLVLGWIWWESHVKDDLWLSGLQSLCLVAAICSMIYSFRVFWYEMGEPEENTQ